MSPMEDDDDKIINTNEWYAEEFVEGTMINLFYSEKGKAWEIATKSTVGGNVTFFSPKNPKENIEVRDEDEIEEKAYLLEHIQEFSTQDDETSI